MHTYNLISKNAKDAAGAPIVYTSGSLLDCWKAMLELFGHLTVKELAERGICIE